MTYLWWQPADLDVDIMLLHEFVDGSVRLRPRYNAYVCPECRTLFPRRAVREGGLDPAVQFSENVDFFKSVEGLTCMSLRFREALTELDVLGLEYHEIPGCPDYAVAFPMVEAHVNLSGSTVRLHPPQCPACGEYEAVTLVPDSTLGISFPAAGVQVFGLDVQAMGRRRRSHNIYSVEEVGHRLMYDYEITGLTCRICTPKPVFVLTDAGLRYRPIRDKRK